MSPIDAAALAEIEERAAKATAGPWGLCDSSDARSKGYIRPLNFRDDMSRPAVARICTTGHRWQEWNANAALIAHARTDVPLLAAALREAVGLLRRALCGEDGACFRCREGKAAARDFLRRFPEEPAE